MQFSRKAAKLVKDNKIKGFFSAFGRSKAFEFLDSVESEIQIDLSLAVLSAFASPREEMLLVFRHFLASG